MKVLKRGDERPEYPMQAECGQCVSKLEFSADERKWMRGELHEPDLAYVICPVCKAIVSTGGKA